MKLAIVAQVPAVTLGVVRRQEVSKVWGAEHLAPQPQGQGFAPLTERGEAEALEGTLVSARPHAPSPILPPQDNPEAAPLDSLQGLMLLLC